MTTDFRALCAELVDELDAWIGYGDEGDTADAKEVVDRARAALAEPEPEGPTDEELMRMAAEALGYESISLDRVDPDGTVEAYGDELLAFARVVLARWGRPALQPADGEVADVMRWLRSRAGISASPDFPAVAAYLTRAADLLERLDRYDQALSAVMPPDFKDWWQNSREEWPDVAAGVIESLRKREELAWEQVERLSPPQPSHWLPAHALPVPSQTLFQ